MSGTKLIFKSGAGPMVAHLARLAARREWTGARNDIGEYLVGDVQDNLYKQRLFDGKSMPQSKAAIARAGKTLIDSHQLYDSYVYQLVRGGLEVGSNKVYAAIHHFGGAAGRGYKTKIVPRPVLGLGERQERRIGAYLVAAIEAMQ
jgi:phage gpG-like protein